MKTSTKTAWTFQPSWERTSTETWSQEAADRFSTKDLILETLFLENVNKHKQSGFFFFIYILNWKFEIEMNLFYEEDLHNAFC